MSIDISKYVKEKVLYGTTCYYIRKKVMPSVKFVLIKKITKTVYGKNRSTKTILDHLRGIHGIGKNSALVNDPGQKNSDKTQM
jgi:hypothetical protein